MAKYKVGDVAALFSKPKNPTTTAGKKLQSLFDDFYNKSGKSAFHSQGEQSETNKTEESKEMSDQSSFKKSRKRKFSSTNDLELSENISSKKFKESAEQEGSNRFKKLKKQKDFPRKDNNHSELNDDVFSKKFKASPELEKHYKSSEDRKFKKSKKQQDFPRKHKHSKPNSFNTTSTFPNFEAENISKNDMELQSVSKLNNKKQSKSFIKKSKKKSFDYNGYKSPTGVADKDSNDSDDASLKNEIEEFMRKNSGEKKKENNNNVKQEKAFNRKGQNTIRKPKKKFLANESSQQKYEESIEQDVEPKKMNGINNGNQQAFPRTKKELKSNAFNFGDLKSKNKYGGIEQDSSPKKPNSVEQDHVKKSKKPKHEFNDTIVENNSETNTHETGKIADFIRKPKNKKADSFDKDYFKKSNSKTFGNVNTDKSFKSGEFVNSGMQIQEHQEKLSDFVKLPNLYDENNEKNSEERLGRTLFVGNLPKNINKQELKNLFCTFGAIETVRLTGVETDKSKIFGKNPPKLLHANYASDTVPGFIVYKDKQSAVEALKLSGCMFKGHHITVDFALPAGSHKLYDDKRSIFIGNLPFDVKDESVWNAFNHCGKIECVRVVRDRKTGLGKGFGYVLFSTVESKQNALALENLHIEGREIRIKAVNSNKKAQKSDSSPTKRDTFKSRAIRMKKNNKVTSGRKSIKKLTNKQKLLHKKKKIASVLQKAMK